MVNLVRMFSSRHSFSDHCLLVFRQCLIVQSGLELEILLLQVAKCLGLVYAITSSFMGC